MLLSFCVQEVTGTTSAAYASDPTASTVWTGTVVDTLTGVPSSGVTVTGTTDVAPGARSRADALPVIAVSYTVSFVQESLGFHNPEEAQAALYNEMNTAVESGAFDITLQNVIVQTGSANSCFQDTSSSYVTYSLDSINYNSAVPTSPPSANSQGLSMASTVAISVVVVVVVLACCVGNYLYARKNGKTESVWRDRLSDTFKAVVIRDSLSKRPSSATRLSEAAVENPLSTSSFASDPERKSLDSL